MKRTVRIAMSVGTPFVLAVFFFFFLVNPARAPSGGKLWTGGRTIASLQEEDFDRRLLKLQLCHGVRLVADQCTLERRRVCKAMLVHEIESTLGTPGRALKSPVDFRCEDTAISHPGVEDDSVSLRPNGEIQAIQGSLGPLMQATNRAPGAEREAQAACEFLTDCKWAMRPQSLSFRKLASCLTTTNATHRKVLYNELGAMVFGAKGNRSRTLYSNLLETGEK